MEPRGRFCCDGPRGSVGAIEGEATAAPVVGGAPPTCRFGFWLASRPVTVPACRSMGGKHCEGFRGRSRAGIHRRSSLTVGTTDHE